MNPNAPGSWNLYAYTQNSPANSIDPLGLKVPEDGDGIVTTTTCHDVTMPVFNGEGYSGDVYADTVCTVHSFIDGSDDPWSGDQIGPGGPGDSPTPADVDKNYSKTIPCASSASRVMGAVESSFPSFGNFKRWLGAESVVFSPTGVLQPGLTIPISVSVAGIPKALSVTVSSANPYSMTFTTTPGHLLYPAQITFSAENAGNGAVTFNIDLSGDYPTLSMWAAFETVGSSFENAQWNHFLDKVAGFCGAQQ